MNDDALRDVDRLAAVEATGLLDTPADPAFDRLASLAGALLHAPYALITLIDARRSFWKACMASFGAPDPGVREDPVEDTFCQHVIGTGQPLILGDVVADPRTRDNPSIERHGVMAYAGYPIVSDGKVLGTFCVIDVEQRRWTEEDVTVLEALAGAASSEIQLRASAQRERSSRDRLARMAAATAGLAAADDALSVARCCAEGAQDLLGSSGIAVLTVDGGLLRLRASRDLDERVVRELEQVPLDAPLALTACVRDGRSVWMSDREEWRRVCPAGEATFAPAAQACAVIPLTGERDVVGVMVATFSDRRPFSPDERQLARTLAGAGAEALKRARLHEETRAGRERAALRAEIGTALEQVRGSGARMARLVELLVPRFADVATIEVAGADGERRVAATAAREGRAPDDGDGPPADPPRSAIAVPMTSRDGPETTLSLATTAASGRRYGAADRAFARDLADRAALSIENELLYERERGVATKLQHGLLDAPPLDHDRLAVAALYRPAVAGTTVGGDWHDAMLLEDGRVALVVGDIVGKGIDAAAAMGQLRSAVRALAPGCAGPADLLRRLDAFTKAVPAVRMATMACAVVDPVTGEVAYACAGHPPPALVTAEGDGVLLWAGRSGPLGVNGGRGREEATTVVNAGDTLLLYTDGLVERRGRRLDAGLERLCRMAGPLAREPLDALVTDLAAGAFDDALQSDDVAILAARVSRPTVPLVSATFSSDPTQLSAMRRTLRTWLSGRELSRARMDDVLLAVGEAAANAVEHAYPDGRRGDIRLSFRETDADLVVTVADRGAWQAVAAVGERGRGLGIMRAAADDLTIERRGRGTQVVLTWRQPAAAPDP